MTGKFGAKLVLQDGKWVRWSESREYKRQWEAARYKRLYGKRSPEGVAYTKRLRRHAKTWAMQNPDKVQKYMDAYYSKPENIEKNRARVRKWNAANKDHVKKYKKRLKRFKLKLRDYDYMFMTRDQMEAMKPENVAAACARERAKRREPAVPESRAHELLAYRVLGYSLGGGSDD